MYFLVVKNLYHYKTFLLKNRKKEKKNIYIILFSFNKEIKEKKENIYIITYIL